MRCKKHFTKTFYNPQYFAVLCVKFFNLCNSCEERVESDWADRETEGSEGEYEAYFPLLWNCSCECNVFMCTVI